MNDTSSPVAAEEGSAGLPPKVSMCADLTVAAFDIIRAVVRNDPDQADDILAGIDKREGWMGLLATIRALALLTIEMGELDPAAIAAALDGDDTAWIERTFCTVHPATGETFNLDGEQRTMVTCALQFMVNVYDDANIHDVAAEFRAAYLLHVPATMLVTGVLMVLAGTLAGLPTEIIAELATFTVDKQNLLAEAGYGDKTDRP